MAPTDLTCTVQDYQAAWDAVRPRFHAILPELADRAATEEELHRSQSSWNPAHGLRELKMLTNTYRGGTKVIQEAEAVVAELDRADDLLIALIRQAEDDPTTALLVPEPAIMALEDAQLTDEDERATAEVARVAETLDAVLRSDGRGFGRFLNILTSLWVLHEARRRAVMVLAEAHRRARGSDHPPTSTSATPSPTPSAASSAEGVAEADPWNELDTALGDTS